MEHLCGVPVVDTPKAIFLASSILYFEIVNVPLYSSLSIPLSEEISVHQTALRICGSVHPYNTRRSEQHPFNPQKLCLSIK